MPELLISIPNSILDNQEGNHSTHSRNANMKAKEKPKKQEIPPVQPIVRHVDKYIAPKIHLCLNKLTNMDTIINLYTPTNSSASQ